MHLLITLVLQDIQSHYKDNSSNDVAMNARNNPYHGGCGFLTSEMAMYLYTVMARSEKASNYLFVIIKKALTENGGKVYFLRSIVVTAERFRGTQRTIYRV